MRTYLAKKTDQQTMVTMEPQEVLFVFVDDEQSSTLMNGLNTLRKNGQFCDVVLQVGQHEVHAHRAILACASPFLFDLFSEQTNNNTGIACFKLNNIDYEAFELLINYAYTSRLEVPPDMVKNVYKTASKLKMSKAVKACGQYLINHLSPKNSLSVRAIAHISCDPDVLSVMDGFIQANLDIIMTGKEFVGLPRLQVEVLQRSEQDINATNQKNLCLMVVDWLKSCIQDEAINMDVLTEKKHLLYLKENSLLLDCNEVEDKDINSSEIVQDYKQLSKKLMITPNKNRNKTQTPVKPRQLLFSISNTSVDRQAEQDWKLVAFSHTADRRFIAIATLSGQLFTISIHQRVATPNSSPSSSRPPSVSVIDHYMPIPNMSSGRCAVGTASINGQLLVCGGYDRGECLSSAQMYDPKTNLWTILKPMLHPRGRFDITVLNGKVFAVGGSSGSNDLNSVESYDPVTQKWTKLPVLPSPRSHAGVCTLTDKLYCIGGWSGQCGIKRCDVYDPNTESWIKIAPLLVGRSQAGVCVMNGCVYAVGGSDQWNCLNTVEMYNPKDNSWCYLPPMNTCRRGAGVSEYKGKLYVVGGSDGSHSLCTVEVYDPETEIWSMGPSMTACRANVGVSVVENRIFAVGGYTGKMFLNSIEYLDPDTNEWTTFIKSHTDNFDNLQESFEKIEANDRNRTEEIHIDQ